MPLRQGDNEHVTEHGSPARCDAEPATTAAPRSIPILAIAADVVRHLLPLAPLYLFGGSFANYLLLTAYVRPDIGQRIFPQLWRRE
jgi:hypothetical protein